MSLSRKILDRLLWSTDPRSQQSTSKDDSHSSRKSRPIHVENGTSQTLLQTSTKEHTSRKRKELLAQQQQQQQQQVVEKLLSLDQTPATAASGKRKRKSSSHSRTKNSQPRRHEQVSSTIVTNSRGSAALAQKRQQILPTFNKEKAEQEKKNKYFSKLAKKLQKDEQIHQKRLQKKQKNK